MAIIKLSATERRRVSAFFTCLVVAACAWVFTVLSNPYNYPVKAALNFRNTPQKRAYHSLQPDTVSVMLHGTGWQMMFSRMNNAVIPIAIDLRSLEYKNYIVLSSQLNQVNYRKDPAQQIIAFSPDTLYFDFSNRKIKKVPVQLVSSLKFKHQFTQSNKAIMKPSYVILNGPANVIDKISSWNTDTLKLDSISEPVTTRLNLQGVKEGNMSVYPKSVQVSIPVDEFTEKTLQIPVKLINNHNYYDVKVFPQKVKVTFTTILGRYAETGEEFFEATADLDLWRLHGYSVLPVVLSKIPPFCKIVKIEPRNIDFIIKK